MMFRRKKGGMSVWNYFVVVVLVCMEYYVDSSQLVSGEEVIIRCVERERQALLRFKKELINDYGALSSWGSEDSKKECCKWKGVVCTKTNTNTTAHVIALRLGSDPMFSPNIFQPMIGNISDALFELRHLTYLDLSWNYIFYQFPQFIGSMKQLNHLNLNSCGISGNVPPQLGNLTNLRTLDLSFNPGLRSDNLDWLSHLSSLTRLDLSYSFDLSQTSRWFPQILKLRSLQELRLSHSNISAIVPLAKDNSSLTSLSILDLSNNELTSSKELVDWLFNISTSLAEINMAHNDLDGPLPVVFGEMIYLEHLDLSYNMLEGVIPKSLGNLTRLRTLSLSSNEFRGDLEELCGNLSAKVKFSLESLYLSHNQLNGSLSQLKAFPSLRKLDLGSNNFVGLMPQSLSHHSSLEVLDLSFNSMEGTISEAYFTKLHNLKVLDLSFNSLTLQIAQDWIPPFQLDAINLGGCKMNSHDFPKWIQTQSNLTNLDLPYASISDEVPKWLWSFSPSLSFLNISHNQIHGNVPHLSSTLLGYLDVSSNKLSGPLPLLGQNIDVVQLSQNMFSGSISSICSLSLVKIWILDLSDNQFSGEIPNCWDKMSGLAYLNLGDNNFSGEIPLTLGTLGRLNSLHLRGNNLSGDLPSTLRNCRQLMFFDVGGNKLTGNIPAWIGGWNSYMIYMILSGNKFHGSIPPEICNLTYIRVLDLSRNNISGEIPHCFSKFSSLTEKNTTIPIYYSTVGSLQTQFEYALVQWKGVYFEYNKLLEHLRLIDLSSNRLVGTIPESFSSLRALISLNLSRNMLEGSIMSRIGEMEMLEVLDLSRNKLCGHIPIGLAQLHFLAVLDLANNSLSGKIPSSTQLQSFNASVYDGNDELCGLPLKLCPGDVPNKQGKEMKEDGGSVSLSFMQGFIISIVMGFIVGFWGAVGSLVLKRSWRYAYFNFLDEVKDWFFVKTALLFKASSTPR